ncbi:hypothetical protein [Burkholderia plantarii]|uniref:hypothetical protein n=1 Tax=Burkholderia plantarii TaxID=41899 RepID=UPI000B1C9782|nr:hypothetical protein [Burkholderia plantarii]
MHNVKARRSAVIMMIIFMIGLGVSGQADAAIDVIPKVAEVTGNVEQLKIINRGHDVEYVSISLSRLVNPGVPLEEERLEPISDAERPALYAYPFRLTLAPGQTKSVSLQPLTVVGREMVYRLHVKPEVKLSSGVRRGIEGGVVVKLGFSILIRQLPKEPQKKISIECDSSGAKFIATGNVRYRVRGVKVEGKTRPDFNVYPGTPIHQGGQSIQIPGFGACEGKGQNKSSTE